MSQEFKDGGQSKLETILILLAGAAVLFTLERIMPDQKLENTKNWWGRVVILNVMQATIVLIGGHTWEKAIQKYRLFEVEKELGVIPTAFLCYFVITFIFYWWHRWRHEVNFLWLSMHQIHHSPSRIETITSFYKHPLEIFCNSIIISVIIYIFIGASVETAALVTLITGYAEFFYHMNIRTPHFIGYFFQRPEMHRIHHQRGVHYSNFSDLPFWDMLFGTFKNPKTYKGKCGFKTEREQEIWKMLAFKNVNNPYPQESHEI